MSKRTFVALPGDGVSKLVHHVDFMIFLPFRERLQL